MTMDTQALLSSIRAGEDTELELADRLIAAGWVGMRVPSFASGAAANDVNLVFWRWGDRRPSRIVLIDDERRHLDARGVRQYLTPAMRTSVSTKGQIVLPAEIRRRDDVEPGQEFDVERIERGEYRLVRRAPATNEGVVDWLLDCPEKGYFVPIESESTDTL